MLRNWKELRKVVGLGNYIAMQGTWLCILCVIDVSYMDVSEESEKTGNDT